MIKEYSARKFMAILFAGTTCIGFLLDKVSGEAFLPIVLLMCQWYFQKVRNNEQI